MRLAKLAFPLLALACGGTPTAPKRNPPLPLHAGPFVLSLSGDTIECNDLTLPQAGTSITVRVMLTASDVNWEGRAASAEGGTFQFRLGATSGAASPITVGAAGAVTGTMIDSFAAPGLPAPSGTRAEFGSAGNLAGEIATSGFFAQGAVTSPVIFTRSSRSVTCPGGAVKWYMVSAL